MNQSIGEKNRRGAQILVVDDEVYVIKIVSKMLHRSGYRTCCAATGCEAIEIFSQHSDQIDLVLLDLMLPDMACVEVYDALTEIEPGIKIVVSTGYTAGNRPQKIPGGISGFLEKPYKMQTLAVLIADLLHQSNN